MLNKIANETGDEASVLNDPENAEVTSIGGDQKLREEAEKQLVSFCGHILKEVSTLQPAPSEAVQADYHRALALRSSVTVQVVGCTHLSVSVLHAPSYQVARSKTFCTLIYKNISVFSMLYPHRYSQSCDSYVRRFTYEAFSCAGVVCNEQHGYSQV